MLLERFFSIRGHTVVVVEDGQQLLDELVVDHYDLVITDNSMPLVTGIQALKRIRLTEHLKDIPVIVLTADFELEEAIKKAGGICFLKGDSLFDLLDIIDKITSC